MRAAERRSQQDAAQAELEQLRWQVSEEESQLRHLQAAREDLRASGAAPTSPVAPPPPTPTASVTEGAGTPPRRRLDRRILIGMAAVVVLAVAGTLIAVRS